MIAAVRVRFTPTPPSQMWDDAVFGNWLNLKMQNSLAHFWYKSSFTLADLKFQIFPPIVIDDPRLKLTPEERENKEKARAALVNGVTAKVTDNFHPDWSLLDGILIWFAQQTDLFGGGGYPVPLPLREGGFLEDFIFGAPEQHYKNLPVAVSDIDSPFHAVCQELGHAYGFEHPFDRAGGEYGDPYDSMASAWYGGVYSSAFERPKDPALPVGKIIDKVDQQSIIGPYVSAANLAISPLAATLRSAGMFIDLPPSYVTGASFTLHALDDAIGHFPAQRLSIVAVIPPDMPGGDTYFLELRRASGYDSGLRKNAADKSKPPIGVVIHSYDKVRNRIVYVDMLPLVDNRGDCDYHLFGGGGFTFRVTSIGADFRSVGITIGGREFWRHFGVNIEDVQHDVLTTTETEWQKVEVSPCFMFSVGDYYYHYKHNFNSYTLVVSSFGYEKPSYVWTVNGTVLDPSVSMVKVSASVESPAPTGKTIVTKLVPIKYSVDADRLTMSCDPEIGNFSLVIEVKSVETSPEVMKNFYEDKSVVTSVHFNNVALEWDDNYKKRQKECKDALEAVNKKHIPQRKVRVPRPEDPFQVRNIEALISEIYDVSLGVSKAVVDEVVRVANIVKGQISKRR